MINVILDTDVANEVDDQFALSYLVRSLEDINLEAITIAPFLSKYVKTENIKQGTFLSYDTTCSILDMLNASELKNKLFLGAFHYFNESKMMNDATTKIIEICKKNKKTTIVAIGALTNVALAFYHAPEIISKCEVIWLGGHSFLGNDNREFNFRQDVEAVKTVFNSKVKLTIIPCKNVGSYMIASLHEIKYYLSDLGEIGSYLCSICENLKKIA